MRFHAILFALLAFGLLLTTLALSLGAPFWFDLLQKVANIRSAAKSTRHQSGSSSSQQ